MLDDSLCGRVVIILQQQLLVEDILADASAHTLQLGDVAANFANPGDLLIEEVLLQEVLHMRVRVLLGHVMQRQEGGVQLLLALERQLHTLQRAAPVVAARLLDGLEDDTATALVDVLHELLGELLHVPGRAVVEELGETLQCHIVTVEVVRHRLVHVARADQHVDLVVDRILVVLVEVLTDFC